MTMRKAGAQRSKRLKPTDRVMVKALGGDEAKVMEAIHLLRRASDEMRRGGHVDRWQVVHDISDFLLSLKGPAPGEGS